MNPISLFAKLPESKKISERSELIKFFVENLKDKKNKPYKPARIGMLLSHLSVKDLYYFTSVSKDIQKCKGQTAFQKHFWWSLKAK